MPDGTPKSRKDLLFPPAPLGRIELAIIGAGLALRLLFLILGKSPLDGDEMIMGLMGFHLSRFEHAPIFFYGQHYMGTLEVPLLALIQRLGPEGWAYSAWPLRFTQAVYFAFFAVVHFKLCARFFDRRAARWILFFTIIGPFFWIDFSSRLRHVVLMMALGELAALAGLMLLEKWRNESKLSKVHMFALGLILGLAWWHYQLILIYFPGLILLFFFYPGFVKSTFARSKSPDLPVLATTLAMAAGLSALAMLSREWLAEHHEHFAMIIIGFVSLFALAAFIHHKILSSRESPSPIKRIPLFVGLGFLCGTLPTLIYLAGLQEELWVMQPKIRLDALPQRLGNLIMLEISALLEITSIPEGWGQVLKITPRGLVIMLCFMGSLYVAARTLIASKSWGARCGISYFTLLAASLLALNVVAPRVTKLLEPRFLIPLFATTSVLFGLFANELMDTLAPRNLRQKRIFAITCCAIAIALWAPRWVAEPTEEISFPSGHRTRIIEISEAIEAHGVERIQLARATSGILLGYELQYLTRLRIRFNRGLDGDRLEGIVDESQYSGPLYRMNYIASIKETFANENERADYLKERGGFIVGPYVIIPDPAPE